MKIIRWIGGAIIIGGAGALIILKPLPFLHSPDMAHAEFFGRALYIIILACVLGPTGADRIVAIDILGIMIIGLCAILTVSTGRSWYIDIGIAWALQSFISTLALSKYLEGRGFDD
jgi:multicomponent Na+:H+ antiporter subunit F